MTDLRKLLDEATPGPWRFDPHGIDDYLGDVWAEPGDEEERICENALIEDARLIALAPQLAAALIKAEEALMKIAALDDLYASKKADATGDYGWFDEPGSVQTARAALSEIRDLTGGGK